MRKQTPSLQEAFAFSADDLALNRKGKLAPTQIAIMRQYLNNATTALVGLVFILVVLGLLGVIIFNTLGLTTLAFLAALLMFILPVLGYQLTKSERNKWRSDLRQNAALCEPGEVQLKTSVKSLLRGIIRFNQYRLMVNGLEFAISEDQYQAVTDGMRYHVYYIPQSEMILSLEETTD